MAAAGRVLGDMKLTLQQVKPYCGPVDDSFIRNHLERLDDRYFNRFEVYQIAGHINELRALSPENPVAVLFDRFSEHSAGCTVLSFDYPAVFAAITGILNALDFDILAGNVFTYSKEHGRADPSAHRKRFARRRVSSDPLHRRRIVDHFTGILTTGHSWNDWKRLLVSELGYTIRLLEKGDEKAILQSRRHVNELVAERLTKLEYAQMSVLYPVSIDIDNSDERWTRLTVGSENTPAFLYSLSNALSLNEISIEQVSINTVDGKVRDIIDIVNRRGKKLTEQVALNQVKLSVLLTKQFTYFLGRAPDPFVALVRFEKLVEDMVKNPDHEQWLDYIANPRVLQDLARILGTSDYLWEDFIRLQYEELLPILQPHADGHRFSQDIAVLNERLQSILESCSTREEKIERLNEFKDREVYLIDLDHILTKEFNFKVLAAHLTKLAEVIIEAAVMLAYEELAGRCGEPQTVAGLTARFAVFGLGKFGGAALGYASDIELLFVYGDNGKTAGLRVIDNADFYDRIVKETRGIIRAKREGIFKLDLRLRPYGKDGPLACSMENFCNYYGPNGPAHSYERLALVRLRRICGDAGLGEQVERIRDNIVYQSQSINPREIRELREKQYAEKSIPGRLNAKFSPGALVDLEYDVQLLQVIHGKSNAALRTPRLHEALNGLVLAGVLGGEESRRLSDSYDFFRQVINGLRMLRGNATDVFLPRPDDDEFKHLARRMGYSHEDGIPPEQQLRTDFDSQTAIVRSFVARHFGRDTIPGPSVGNVADLVLTEDIGREEAYAVLHRCGFRYPERALVNLASLAGEDRENFARCAVLACDILRSKPDVDMALNNWEQFVSALGSRKEHYNRFLSQPMQLEILLSIFSGSQFLANILIRNPGFLEWVIVPDNLHRPASGDTIRDELVSISARAADHTAWLHELRQFRRREILRIGTLDICLRSPLSLITGHLSDLADGIIRVSLDRIFSNHSKPRGKDGDTVKKLQENFCIFAFGKLGGQELNYSSDIDLLAAYDDTAVRIGESDREFLAGVVEGLRADLSNYMVDGHVFRVDLRLRPYGTAGPLVYSIANLAKYYESTASLWEIQSLLKLRVVAGNRKAGLDLIQHLHAILQRERNAGEIAGSIAGLRKSAIKKQSPTGQEPFDVKVGSGGIRDIEFVVQGLQLIHAHRYPGLVEGSTLKALDKLREYGIVPVETALSLVDDYRFLRRIEHALQILDDQQRHGIPAEKEAVTALAKRVLGVHAEYDEFMQALEECRKKVSACFNTLLCGQNGAALPN
ncbi:MAG: glutamate-ammonia-ligase adenylyltransferase [Chitinivibrionales bacterium]|nr:glutamate-ammonia-ligase adenylyltransferase [Chitinivibrionales bacterium]